MNTLIKGLICILIILILCVGISLVTTNPMVTMFLGYPVGAVMTLVFLVWSDK